MITSSISTFLFEHISYIDFYTSFQMTHALIDHETSHLNFWTGFKDWRLAVQVLPDGYGVYRGLL